MEISIIIPVYNEETTILKFQESIKHLIGKCEILFVDGGSSDKTLELISPEFKVLHSSKGRANQMNFGAKKGSGDVLFFLHCDSELSKDVLEQIRKVMKNYRVGFFGITFNSKNILMNCCEVMSNFRAKYGKIMFGDQGIFIERKLFFEVGGFPKLPIMEDYQFSLNLKKKNIRVGITDKRIYTSDRRFINGGKLKVMWKMNRLRAMYRKGVDIEIINKLYKDIR
jgi:uncharacterized protein